MKKTVGLLCCLALTAAAVLAANMEKATCTANCSPDPYVTCTTASQSSSCTAVDRNCAVGQRGYVVCDGVTKYCASTCPICTNGTYRYVISGFCCDESPNQKKKYRQDCINNQWVDTGEYVCSGPCGVIIP